MRFVDGSKETAVDCLRETEVALRASSDSAPLLCLLGDLIQLSDVEGYELDDARKAYEGAVAADPSSAEAHEALGYYFDVIDTELDRAERCFRRAVELDTRIDSYVGLARVLTELGNRAEAMDLLGDLDSPSEKLDEIRSTTPFVLRPAAPLSARAVSQRWQRRA